MNVLYCFSFHNTSLLHTMANQPQEYESENGPIGEKMFAYNPQDTAACPSCGGDLLSYFGPNLRRRGVTYECINCGYAVKDTGTLRSQIGQSGFTRGIGHNLESLGPGESMEGRNTMMYYKAPPPPTYQNNARGKAKKKKRAKQMKDLLKPEYHGPKWLQRITRDYPQETAYMGPKGQSMFRQMWWNSEEAPEKSRLFKDFVKAEGKASAAKSAKIMKDAMNENRQREVRYGRRNIRSARRQARTGYYEEARSNDLEREKNVMDYIDSLKGKQQIEEDYRIQQENAERKERYKHAEKNLNIIEKDLDSGRRVWQGQEAEISEEMNHWQRIMM